ncbi:MAG: type II toxin-antitoxin system death-on-curing family toxin [Sulfuricella sp.]|jgi:death-on-curing protein
MSDIRIFYFDAAHAIREHDWIIENSGGLAGIREIGYLESVLDHIQNDLYYPEFEGKLSHLIFAINKFHAFNDGNKRSSIALGAYFLELNGFDYCVTKFVCEMENIAVWLAEDKIGKELLGEIVVSIIMDDDYPEDLKLRILHAVSGETGP